MARFALLYCNGDGESRVLIANDEDGSNLPAGADDVLADHGDDYNAAGGTFVVALPDDVSDDPEIMDANGDEIRRDFIDL